MSFVSFSDADMCRVCETQTQQNSLASDENRVIVKKLRACADILVNRYRLYDSVEYSFILLFPLDRCQR